MSSSFLTVEDINSFNASYVVEEVYCVDTSLISVDEFIDVFYDFVKVNHTINDNEHVFTFEIHNNLWDGKYHFVKVNEKPITGSYSVVDVNTLKIITSEESVKLYLFMSSLVKSRKKINHSKYIKNPVKIITKKDIGTNYPFSYCNWDSNGRNCSGYMYFIAKPGVVYSIAFPNLVLFLLQKTDLVFDVVDDLIVGKVNRVKLGVDEDYLPFGVLVEGDELDAVVKYGDLELPVFYDSNLNDYCFDLDLSDKIDDGNVKLDLIVYESEYIKKGLFNLVLDAHYTRVDSFEELKHSMLSNEGVIELEKDIVFTENLIFDYPVFIIGNSHEIDLNSNTILIKKSNVKINDVTITNGQPCFIQNKNTKLILNNIIFRDCSITDEYKGSVVSTLSDENIQTELNSCSIFNCPHSIYHSSILVIENCKAIFNNYDDSIDNDYCMFLNQYDGDCTVRNSVFDLDLTGLCVEDINIKFALAMFGIGEGATFNTIIGEKLKGNDSLNFFDYGFNNYSHVYCEYYYPSISTCVVASPLTGFEGKSVCHAIIGSDFIYKNNVQITRKSDNLHNTIRILDLEE